MSQTEKTLSLSPAQWSKIQNIIDSYGAEITDLQRELVALPAVGPFSDGPGEAAKAAAFEAWLDRLGLEIIHVDCPDDRVQGGLRPNIIGLMPGQSPQRVWFLGHLDIVPPGEATLWNSDPYELKVEGDTLIGRGVEDNNAGIVSSYFAAKAFLDSEITPPLSIGLIAVSDEETGSAFGLEYLLKERPELFSPQDIIVVPDAGNEDGTLIEVAEKSMAWFKFTVKGVQVHASVPHIGRNTLAGAAHMIVALEKLPEMFQTSDPLFDPPFSTFPATKKEANVPNVNTVPGEDVFYIDCRIVPPHTVDEVAGAAKEIVEKIAAERELTVSLEIVNRADSAPNTSPDSPVVKGLTKAIKEITGGRAKVGGIGGGTVAAFFRRAGLPAAVWQTSAGNAHQPNESITLSSLITDAKVMAHLIGYGGD